MNIIILWSVILGFAASVVPNLVFRYCFISATARTPKQVVRFFYVGEALKFLTAIVLLSIILNFSTINIKYFFLAFIMAELGRIIINYIRLFSTR